MINILSDNFVHDIRTFCQIMEYNLPKTYLISPLENIKIKHYNINFDDNNIREI